MQWLLTLKELISQLIDPEKLSLLVAAHQQTIYVILFAVVFCETGLVVTPFLPGDSMLFAAGVVASMGKLNPLGLFLALSAAAVLGDTVNYWVGHYIGPRAFSGEYRLLRKEYLDRTHRFFQRYGGLTIILARFVPIVRTFAPFVAGIGAMNYARFIVYNVLGGVAWVAAFVFAGYFSAEAPLVKKHPHLIILAIIIVSVLPMVVEVVRARLRGEKSPEKE
jgi:membrane-associated protein